MQRKYHVVRFDDLDGNLIEIETPLFSSAEKNKDIENSNKHFNTIIIEPFLICTVFRTSEKILFKLIFYC